MATIVSKNAHLSLAGVVLSTWVRSVAINDPNVTVEDTRMGNNSQVNKPGLYNPGWTIEFAQDYAAGGPDATYWASLRGQTFTAICNPDGSTTSATNPRFTQQVVVSDYNPVSGDVGGLATASLTLVSAGDLSRATV